MGQGILNYKQIEIQFRYYPLLQNIPFKKKVPIFQWKGKCGCVKCPVYMASKTPFRTVISISSELIISIIYSIVFFRTKLPTLHVP